VQYKESLEIMFNPNNRGISGSRWWIQDELAV